MILPTPIVAYFEWGRIWGYNLQDEPRLLIRHGPDAWSVIKYHSGVNAERYQVPRNWVFA
jgi:hypothetical protein